MKGLLQRLRTRPTRGAAAVEFALIMPILTVLCLMTIEMGWYFAHRLSVVNMVSDNMRYAASLDPNDYSVDRIATRFLHSQMKDYVHHSPGLKSASLSRSRVRKYRYPIAGYDHLRMTVWFNYQSITDILGVMPKTIALETSMLSTIKREPRKPRLATLRPPTRVKRRTVTRRRRPGARKPAPPVRRTVTRTRARVR